jgi:hypothetical protein
MGAGGGPFAIDAAGNMFGVNERQRAYCQIVRVAADGRLSMVAGGQWGYRDGRGESAQFENLHVGAMTIGPDGALYVTENGARVRRITTDGVVTTVAGGADRGFRDGPGRKARFAGARGLAFDAAGVLYVADAENHRVRRVTASGQVETVAGTGVAGLEDGPCERGTLLEPSGIAVCENGDLMILDYQRDDPIIRRWDRATGIRTVVRITKEAG